MVDYPQNHKKKKKNSEKTFKKNGNLSFNPFFQISVSVNVNG